MILLIVLLAGVFNLKGLKLLCLSKWKWKV